MNLTPLIVKHQKHLNQLSHERDVINGKISVLANCIDTLRFIQEIQDKHRLLKRGKKCVC